MLAPDHLSAYLQSLVDTYSPQQDRYTLTDLQVEIRIEKPASPEESEARRAPKQAGEVETKIERLPVLAGLRKYLQQGPVLLVGKPGSGKSTALQRLLWEEALTLNPSPKTGRGTLNLNPDALLPGEQRQGDGRLIPVLIELRSYDIRNYDVSSEQMIQKFFRRHHLRLSLEAIDDLLFEGRLLLLLDGVNELPTGALAGVETFRKDNARCSMVFTTRELGAGAGLGIPRRLEMCGLTEPQMREFIHKQLPGQADHLLRQLQNRLRELAETPLLLQILCNVFQADGQIPKNRGELFRKQFAQQYEQFKRLPEILGDSSHLLPQLLQTLAFEMMQGTDPTKPTEFVLQLPRAIATAKLQQWLNSDREKAEHYLQALLKHHLLQQASDPNQIEFCHQLFQEYYAAEYLLLQLHHLNDHQLQCDYLNLLKWTEPLTMVVALIADQTQAMRLVQQALEVDWHLGARLAGEVQPLFQAQTVGLVAALDAPDWLKFQLFRETRSDYAIPGLLQALEDSDNDVRRMSANALGEIGSEAAIRGLLQALEDSDSDVHRSTRWALGQIRSEASIPGLLQALEHSASDVRRRAADALGQIRSEASIPGLLQALEDSASDVRRRAADALGQIRSEAAIPRLLQALEDSASDVRRRAADALGQIGSEAAIPRLLQALEDSASDVRRSAAEALGQIRSEASIPGLLQALEDSASDVRESAAEALGQIRSEASIPGLLQAPEDSDSDVRRRAAGVLGQIRSEAAIPRLLQALEDSASDVRRRAADALGQIGSEAAIPRLLQALEDSGSEVRKSAAEALGQIGSKSAIPGLLQALKDSNYSVCERAAEALGQIGSEAAIPGLLQALEDSDSKVRWIAVWALGQIGSDVAIPGLLQALENSDSKVHWIAAWGLGQIGSDVAILGLLQALKHLNCKVRKSAAEVLGQIGSDVAIPGLLQALEDSNSEVRWRALESLGSMGSGAAIPALLQALDDSNDEVRGKATEALGQIAEQHPETIAQHLPHLFSLIPTDSGKDAHRVILAIQANCKFYSDAIQNEKLIQNEKPESVGGQATYVFPDAREVKIFELVEDYHEHSPGPNQ